MLYPLVILLFLKNDQVGREIMEHIIWCEMIVIKIYEVLMHQAVVNTLKTRKEEWARGKR